MDAAVPGHCHCGVRELDWSNPGAERQKYRHLVFLGQLVFLNSSPNLCWLGILFEGGWQPGF